MLFPVSVYVYIKYSITRWSQLIRLLIVCSLLASTRVMFASVEWHPRIGWGRLVVTCCHEAHCDYLMLSSRPVDVALHGGGGPACDVVSNLLQRVLLPSICRSSKLALLAEDVTMRCSRATSMPNAFILCFQHAYGCLGVIKLGVALSCASWSAVPCWLLSTYHVNMYCESMYY